MGDVAEQAHELRRGVHEVRLEAVQGLDREGDAVIRSHRARPPQTADRALPLALPLLRGHVAPLADRRVAGADEQARAPRLAEHEGVREIGEALLAEAR